MSLLSSTYQWMTAETYNNFHNPYITLYKPTQKFSAQKILQTPPQQLAYQQYDLSIIKGLQSLTDSWEKPSTFFVKNIFLEV